MAKKIKIRPGDCIEFSSLAIADVVWFTLIDKDESFQALLDRSYYYELTKSACNIGFKIGDMMPDNYNGYRVEYLGNVNE